MFLKRSGRRRAIVLAVAAVVLGAGVVVGGAPYHAHAESNSGLQGAGPITVTISDSGVDIPDTIAPGIESFDFVNGGSMPHSLAIVRINDGVTLDQVFAAGQQAASGGPAAQVAFYALVAPNGGADTLDPGASQSVVLNLTAGPYIAVDYDHVTDGVVKPFMVAGDPTTAAAPTADVQVGEHEFAFDLPATVNAGVNVFQVTNTGTQVHMMVLVRLDPGYTVQDVIAHVMDPGPPPAWVHPVPGMVDLAPGVTAWTTLTLDPGVYVALCFDLDPATMMPHVALGMIGTFTAQ